MTHQPTGQTPLAVFNSYDSHVQFSRAEMDGLLLTLINAMATEYHPSNPKGPYAHLLDALVQIACSGSGSVGAADRRFFRERVNATVQRGISDLHAPPVIRTGAILHFVEYVPFRRKWEDINDNRSARWDAPLVRAWHTFTGRAQIEDESEPSYYCKVLDIADDEHPIWPCWERKIRVPKLDVIVSDTQAPRATFVDAAPLDRATSS